MELSKNFPERERLFKERTGKDFQTIYKKYYPKLIYFTNKFCQDRQTAEDISTDAFMTSLDKIHKYDREKSQFSTWLFTIARNLTLQAIKQNKKSISLDIEFDTDGTTMKDFIESDDGVEELIKYEIIEKKHKVMVENMAKLKEPYKTVIEMREIKKMAYKDIAESMNKNLSTIKSQIRNARRILISQTESEFEKIDNNF